MENRDYLNKALFQAQQLFKEAKPQLDQLHDNILPSLKKELKELSPEVSQKVDLMEKAAKKGDIKTLLKIKSEIDANYSKH